MSHVLLVILALVPLPVASWLSCAATIFLLIADTVVLCCCAGWHTMACRPTWVSRATGWVMSCCAKMLKVTAQASQGSACARLCNPAEQVLTQLTPQICLTEPGHAWTTAFRSQSSHCMHTLPRELIHPLAVLSTCRSVPEEGPGLPS